jgi:D-aminopeptidase
MKPGPRNLISDVAGIRVGNASDASLKSGTTVLLADAPFTAAVNVMGGAPGSRETDLLAPDKLVDRVDALVLSGGSALGLDAASSVANCLRAAGRGYDVQGQIVPIVPAAILFDLLNGGDKEWDENPYGNLGRQAFAAATPDFSLGTVGAGIGATTADLKGGLGSASAVLDCGVTVGALVAVNAFGAVTPPDVPQFWAAPWEAGSEANNAEFGGLGFTSSRITDTKPITPKGFSPVQNTTIAIIATDAKLSKAQCQRVAVAAQDGMARAIVPSHTLFDGDLVFAAATGAHDLADPLMDAVMIGHAAATVLARAIARAIWEATPQDGDQLPCFKDKYGL